ncbi:MAG TPA: hypothetical protein PK037_12265 [Saprospiraceae bacterium]|nr:hypothetical protein [Saprospiraceae bacterium]
MKNIIDMRYLLFLTLLLIVACSKTVGPPVDHADLWDCYQKESWDTLKISNALIGEWKWEYVSCFWVPEEANSEDHKGLNIEFKPDRTLVVKQNGVETQTSTWKVRKGTDNFYELEANPFVGQLRGQIISCDPWLELYDSYIDGCDQFYSKVK